MQNVTASPTYKAKIKVESSLFSAGGIMYHFASGCFIVFTLNFSAN